MPVSTRGTTGSAAERNGRLITGFVEYESRKRSGGAIDVGRGPAVRGGRAADPQNIPFGQPDPVNFPSK